MRMGFLLLTYNEFLESVSQGLAGTTTHIYLAIIFLAVFIFIIILISKITKYKENKELKIILNKKYSSLIKELKISKGEKDIIERLSRFLRKPEKKYLLLLNPNVFHSTLNKLRELILKDKKQFLDDRILFSLERKLKFNTISKFSELDSTYDLPNEMSVYVIFNKDQKISGKIKNTEEAINVIIKNSIIDIIEGQKAAIYTNNYSGIYVFYTKLNKIDNNQLSFEHSFKMKALQRRDFFRKNILLPVIIEKTGENNKPVKTVLYDISGGGASFDNTNLGLKAHDDIKISFPDNNLLTLRLNAEVIRCSRDGKISHVKFNHLKDSAQDRIIRLINK